MRTLTFAVSIFALCLTSLGCSAIDTTTSSAASGPPTIDWFVEDDHAGEEATAALSIDAAGNVVHSSSYGSSPGVVRRYAADHTQGFSVSYPATAYVASVLAAADGTTYVVSADSSSVYIERLSASGARMWKKTAKLGLVQGIQETDDGIALVAAPTVDANSIVMIPVTAAGAIEKSRVFPGPFDVGTCRFDLAVRGKMGFSCYADKPFATSSGTFSPAGSDDLAAGVFDLGAWSFDWVTSAGGCAPSVSQVRVTPDGGLVLGGAAQATGAVRSPSCASQFGYDVSNTVDMVVSFAPDGKPKWMDDLQAFGSDVKLAIGAHQIAIADGDWTHDDVQNGETQGFSSFTIVADDDGHELRTVTQSLWLENVEATPAGRFVTTGQVHGQVVQNDDVLLQGNLQMVIAEWR